jgi:osmoprotectant transport system permease protein
MGEAWSDMWDYLGTDAAWNGRDGLPSLLWAHVQLSLVALLLAALVAIPPAVVLGHVRRGALAAVSIVNIGRAIPSFAVIALVLPFSLRWGFGLGFWPTLVALGDVPADAVEAARGMGMLPRELVTRVEVPVALPLILTGLRVSAVQVVATTTLGALVGYRCLGSPIVAGFQRQDKGELLAAAILVALLALVTDALFTVAARAFVPWRARKPGRTADATVAADAAVAGAAAGSVGA